MEIEYFDTDVASALNELVATLLTYTGGIALFILVFSGVYYMSVGGNPSMQAKAKKMFTYAIIGLLIIVLSYAMVRLVSQIAT